MNKQKFKVMVKTMRLHFNFVNKLFNDFFFCVPAMWQVVCQVQNVEKWCEGKWTLNTMLMGVYISTFLASNLGMCI